MTRSLSASKFETLRTCPRLFYFQHVLHIERAREGGARRVGDLFHLALEAWWKISGQGDAPWAPPADEAFHAGQAAMMKSAHGVKTDPYEVARAEAMFAAYHERWKDAEYELLEGQRGNVAIESWFTVALRDYDGRVIPGWVMNGKKDGVARFDRTPRIIEHKSTSIPLDVASPYWEDLKLAMQPSIYIDAAAAYLSEPVDGVLYDVARKPSIKGPQMATPIEEREYTKGKGCDACHGAAKKATERSGVKSSGVQMHHGESVDSPKVEMPCAVCKGTGWKPGDEPRLYAKHREKDETVAEYRDRVIEALAEAPDAHFVRQIVRRSDQQLAEARNDVAQAAREIDDAYRAMEALPNDRAHLAWGRNPKACFSMYGRRCDFIEVCPHSISPLDQPMLYSIRAKPSKVSEPTATVAP